MWRFAFRSARSRLRSQLASGLVTFAGTILLTAFAVLFQTGLTASEDNRSVLILLPLILGGWSVAIVAFGIVSTVALSVQQRERENALLRAIAATPRQVQIMIIAETFVITVPIILLGLLPGRMLGGFILGRLIDVDMVTGPVDIDAGVLAYGTGAMVALLAALAGVALAGRAAGKIPVVRALSEAADAPVLGALLPRPRLIAGLTLIGVGAAMSVTTLFMENGPLLSSTAGPAGVAVAIGLALLSPLAIAAAGRAAASLPGAIVQFAGRNLHVRATRQASVIGPLILLVGIAVGTLSMQATENSADSTELAGEGGQLAPVNYLVVAIIIAFSCIAVANSLISATRHRRREFELLRVTGATDGQIFAVTILESLIAAVIAAALGSLAALATTVPFSLVRTGSPAGADLGRLLILIAGAALAITLLATLPTTMRMLRAAAPAGAR